MDKSQIIAGCLACAIGFGVIGGHVADPHVPDLSPVIVQVDGPGMYANVAEASNTRLGLYRGDGIIR